MLHWMFIYCLLSVMAYSSHKRFKKMPIAPGVQREKEMEKNDCRLPREETSDSEWVNNPRFIYYTYMCIKTEYSIWKSYLNKCYFINRSPAHPPHPRLFITVVGERQGRPPSVAERILAPELAMVPMEYYTVTVTVSQGMRWVYVCLCEIKMSDHSDDRFNKKECFL